MTLSEILKQAKQGDSFTRNCDSWRKESKSLQITPNNLLWSSSLYLVEDSVEVNDDLYYPTVWDLCADDWEFSSRESRADKE